MDLELFIEMLGIPSTSGEERRFADFLKERLAAPEIIEKEVGVPIVIVSTGPDKNQTIIREEIF